MIKTQCLIISSTQSAEICFTWWKAITSIQLWDINQTILETNHYALIHIVYVKLEMFHEMYAQINLATFQQHLNTLEWDLNSGLLDWNAKI